MSEGLIPRRYAKALYKFALERNAATKVYSIMGRLRESFAGTPSLQETLSNPFIKEDDKIKLLYTASGCSGDDTVMADFFKLLAENRRLDMAHLIAIAYQELYREANNIYLVNVTSAAKLSPEDDKRLRAFIEKHLDGATMEYSSSIDPELIGGFVVKINNELLDASISNELKQLRLKLLSH